MSTNDLIDRTFNLFDFRGTGKLSVADAHNALIALGVTIPRPTLAQSANVDGTHFDRVAFAAVVNDKAPKAESKDELFLAFSDLAGQGKTRTATSELLTAANRARLPEADVSLKRLVAEFAEYPSSGLSFPEWQEIAAIARAPRKVRPAKKAAPAAEAQPAAAEQKPADEQKPAEAAPPAAAAA
jgi:hypothetical protein